MPAIPVQDNPRDMSDRLAQHLRNTVRHILEVRWRLLWFKDHVGGYWSDDLRERAVDHDLTKLAEPEASGFAKWGGRLSEVEYGSQEYEQMLSRLRESALNHHYANNPHHPEYHASGIEGMLLTDVIEMFCDWSAATLRHKNGDIRESIEHNQDRFGDDDGFNKVLARTAPLIGEGSPKLLMGLSEDGGQPPNLLNIADAWSGRSKYTDASIQSLIQRSDSSTLTAVLVNQENHDRGQYERTPAFNPDGSPIQIW